MSITVTLTHFDLGPIRVRISEDATWWFRRRHWTCDDDPELGLFEDSDFEEAPSTIEIKLLAAHGERLQSHEGVGDAARLSSLA